MPKRYTASSGFILALLLTCGAPLLAQNGVRISNFTGQVSGLRHIRTVSYQTGEAAGAAKLAFDDQFAYLATPDGLFRTAQPFSADAPLTPIGFSGQHIFNLYVHNNVLYVLKEGGDPSSNTLSAHSFLKSVDHGQTFVPLDEGLKWCFRGSCQYMSAVQAVFRNDLIFLTAGGGRNLFVTKDEGKNWVVLLGSMEPQACYDPAFEVTGNKVLIGGECPLDFAYLWVGTLREDMLGWTDSGRPRVVMGLPELDNRNVQFIKHSPNTSIALAGTEGAVLKTDDQGESYHFVIKHPISGGEQKYPYVRRIIIPSKYQDLMLVGGYDKPNFKGYFAYSKDHGESWTDISNLILTPEWSPVDVTFLTEDAQGRILIGLNHSASKIITIAEVLLIAPPTLLTEIGSERAIAFDSVTLMRESFSPFNPHNFSADGRTRVSLFATNVELLPGDIITAQAEDSQHRFYQLPIEAVERIPNFRWLTQVTVRLPVEIGGAGDVRLSINVRGAESNKVLLDVR